MDFQGIIFKSAFMLKWFYNRKCYSFCTQILPTSPCQHVNFISHRAFLASTFFKIIQFIFKHFYKMPNTWTVVYTCAKLCSEIRHYSSNFDNRVVGENVPPINKAPFSLDPRKYVMRKYGNHWKDSLAAKKSYSLRDKDELNADDFIIFEHFVSVQPHQLVLHKRGNCQGAVVRVWGGVKHPIDNNILTNLPSGRPWMLLWSGEAICYSDFRARIIPLKKAPVPINIIKIELRHDFVSYYPKINKVCLHSDRITQNVIDDLLSEMSLKTNDCYYKSVEPIAYIERMPTETMLTIFQHLDLKSLRSCSSVNRRWNWIANDPRFYINVDLSLYWNTVNADCINSFSNKFTNIEKLDLSNCNLHHISYDHNVSDMDTAIQNLLNACRHSLTHISMENNISVTPKVLRSIALCPNLLELRLNNTFNWIRFGSKTFVEFKHLQTLDLSTTHIKAHDLIRILQRTPELLHLLIENNPQMCNDFGMIVSTLSNYNRKLKCWSSWKSFSNGSQFEYIGYFIHLPHLEELDLGYCAPQRMHFDIFESLGIHCKKLRRLILTDWKCLETDSVLSIAFHFKELKTLDLRGCKGCLSMEICVHILVELPQLRLLDISSCDCLTLGEFFELQRMFPHVEIKGFIDYSCNI
ncbi:hypothetical protein ABEB36_006876 [Hypothenemus hampei]|uniref:F-box domain-containing protein n=1 Tax=Hypothenemus hampei TaxID=57062 RepID=A0ABD1ESJ5_HYPHA